MSSNKELLTQEFFLYPKKTVASVTLTNEAITVTSLSSNPKSSYVIKLDDVIGCHVLQGNLTTLSTWYLCIFSYPLKKKVFSGHSRQRLTRSLGVPQSNGNEDTKAIAEKWKSAIKYLCTGSKLTDAHDIPVVSPRRFLVYVNPFSGSGKALQIYEKDVRRLFSEAEITHTKFKTDYAGHAKEDVKAVDLSKYDGIVIVSGDGLIHEVINGLMERDDWEEAIKTPLGVVPGGSGNALAASIVYASTGSHPLPSLLPYTSIFEICKGHVAEMDLISMDTYLPGKTGSRSYGTLGTMLGLIADIDIESETMRCFGQSFRTTLYAILKIAKMKEYKVSISYLPIGYKSRTAATTAEENHAFLDSTSSVNHSNIRPNPYNADQEQCNELSAETLSNDWITTSDSYISVQALALSHMSYEHIMFPDLKLSSGYMNIALLKTRSRSKIFKLWDNLEDGTGFGSPGKNHLTVIPCSAFRITPASKQIVTLDGELISYNGEVHCKIHNCMARVFTSRPPDSL